MRVLHRFPHGLGDAVQFTAFLKHLHVQRPHWDNFALGRPGRLSAWRGLARAFPWRDDHNREGYDLVLDHQWWESAETYSELPPTKNVKALHDLGLTPQPHLLTYSIQVRPETRWRVHQYARTLPGRYAILHYEGNSSRCRKDLDHEQAHGLCQLLLERGLTPVILDWQDRSPLPDNRTIFCPGPRHELWPDGDGDAETIAALAELAAVSITVDSGPQKAIIAAGGPVLAVWTGNHPLHYCDLNQNVRHLLPPWHERLIQGQRRPALDVLNKRYRTAIYHDLLRTVASELEHHD